MVEKMIICRRQIGRVRWIVESFVAKTMQILSGDYGYEQFGVGGHLLEFCFVNLIETKTKHIRNHSIQNRGKEKRQKFGNDLMYHSKL